MFARMKWQRANHWRTTQILCAVLGQLGCQSGLPVRSPVFSPVFSSVQAPGQASDRTAAPPVLSERRVHLVIDIGSSGTSLCLFPVQRAVVPSSHSVFDSHSSPIPHSDRAQASPRCSVGAVEPVCAKSKGGLAQLVIGKSPTEITTLVMARLRESWRQLGDVAPTGRPDWRSEVRSAAALGTGGFRDSETGQPILRPEWRVLWQAVQQFLQHELALSQVVARPITGSEEGQLAWVGVREALAPTERFAIMEVGGATVQFATADSPRETDLSKVVAVSDGRGQDLTFDKLSAAQSAHAGFSVCFSPDHRERQSGAACLDLLYESVFSDARVAGLAAVTPVRRVYALGAPWLGLLREFPSAPPWKVKTDRELPSQVRFQDLRALAELVCSKSDRQILTLAPHSYEAKRGIGRTCYSVAYHAAYFQAIAPAAKSQEVIPGGDEQWARGAAISGAFFSDCREHSAK